MEGVADSEAHAEAQTEKNSLTVFRKTPVFAAFAGEQPILVPGSNYETTDMAKNPSRF